MGKLFRNWDLLKAMIFVFLLAAGALAIWNQVLSRQVDEARRAFTRSQSDIVEVHSLLKEMKPLRRAMSEQAASDPDIFFQTQMSKAGFGVKDYQLQLSRPATVSLADGKKAEDVTMSIEMLGKDRFVTRNQWFTAAYNCEKNPSNWRLRTLHVTAKEVVKGDGRDTGYKTDMSDEWQVRKLVFASRRPPPK